ncbi:MAG: hypothetical protein AB1349_14440 [Elusimicrobiota bacterium]
MKKEFNVNLLVFCLLFAFSVPVYSEIAKGKFGVGLNYPGLGARYFISDKISVELKTQIEKDISVSGLRGYYYREKA